MGKERCCFRGIDLIHGPTSNGISGNFMIKPYQLAHKTHVVTPVDGIPNCKSIKITMLILDFVHRSFISSASVNSSSNFWLTMFPEKRYFFETSTTEVAIHTNLLSDLYASIGTGSSRTGWYTTIMKQPFLILIRIGFFFASLGGSRCLLRKLKKEKLEFGD